MAEGAENNRTGLSPRAEKVLARAKEVRERKCLTEFDPAAVEENLASIRRTLGAIDDLNDRWKVNTWILSPLCIRHSFLPLWHVRTHAHTYHRYYSYYTDGAIISMYLHTVCSAAIRLRALDLSTNGVQH